MTPQQNQLGRTAVDFVDEAHLAALLEMNAPEPARIREILAKSMALEPLSEEETAALLAVRDPELIAEIFDGAHRLKERVYGNRIVLFAPLYLGSECVNDCSYCAFRRSNKEAVRRSLGPAEIASQVEVLEDLGHKRLILVFGEHPKYDAEAIAEAVRTVYGTKKGRGEIRRVNINAAPLDREGFALVKQAGIGTYQIFMETYHHATYARCHPADTRKGDYLDRLDGVSRAMEAGCDDVGIGVLFGLYDWRFEVLGLVSHARFLMERFGVGPHTISFPRLRPALDARVEYGHSVSDADFVRIVAILRLAVPYTGLILTAREEPELRRRVMAFGVSQIDAGSRIGIGAYTESGPALQAREQFSLGDSRSLDEVMAELLEDGYIPSFCTACYRLGRTGEHFMEFAIPGFIKRFCTPNALLTLQEYLEDYAGERSRAVGERLLEAEVARLEEGKTKELLRQRLRQIHAGDERDLYF